MPLGCGWGPVSGEETVLSLYSGHGLMDQNNVKRAGGGHTHDTMTHTQGYTLTPLY